MAVKIKKGAPQRRESQPFSQLKKGEFFEIPDLTKWGALRNMASLAGKRLARKFSVNKVELPSGREVIRVYRR